MIYVAKLYLTCGPKGLENIFTNILQKGGEAIANHSPLGKGAVQGAQVAGKMAKSATSVGGKTLNTGMEALAQQSPVGRALSKAAKATAGNGKKPQQGAHQKIMAEMQQHKPKNTATPDFSAPQTSNNHDNSDPNSSTFEHAQRELVEKLKQL